MARKLASIRKISSIEAIPGADFIVLATVDNWKCITKKDEFSEGDLCVFFEPDAVLPKEDWSEFMKRYKYRVRTIKMRGVYSQGLVLPIETVGLNVSDVYEGMDIRLLLVSPSMTPKLQKNTKRTIRRENLCLMPG